MRSLNCWARQAASLIGVAALGFWSLPAVASSSVDHQTAPQWASTPRPPDITVDPTKDGVTVRGNAKVDGRLGASHPKSTSKHTPAKHVPTVVDAKNLTKPLRRDDLRLNLGICGRVGTDGTVPGPTRCQPFTPDRPDVPPPPGGVVRRLPRPEDVTWEQILAQYRNVLFPKLGVKVQPVGRTLVNLDTIVYTDESKVSVNTVTLLGFPVVVEATPVSYTWHFGDGASVTTTTPGEAYPAKEITHKYMKRGNVKVTLTTNYAARYNVAGTGWQYVDGTVPIVGPATALLVREAVPVLVDPQR